MNCRGIGPSEMGYAIEHGEMSILNPDMSYHVLEVAQKIRKSGNEGKPVQVESVCSVPKAFIHQNVGF